jgi:hypothetical protein
MRISPAPASTHTGEKRSPFARVGDLGEVAVIPNVAGSPTGSGHGPRPVVRVEGGDASNCRSALRITDRRQWAKTGIEMDSAAK